MFGSAAEKSKPPKGCLWQKESATEDKIAKNQSISLKSK